MATSGRVSIEVVADFARFAGDFQRQIQSAINGVTVDMSGVASGIQRGLTQGAEAGFNELRRQSDATVTSLQGLSTQSRETGQGVQALSDVVQNGSSGLASVARAAEATGLGLVGVADATVSANDGMLGLAGIAVDDTTSLLELAATIQMTGSALDGVAESSMEGEASLTDMALGAGVVAETMGSTAEAAEDASQGLEQTADSAETAQQDLNQVGNAAQQTDEELAAFAAGVAEARQDLRQIGPAAQQADEGLTSVGQAATEVQQDLNQVGNAAQQADQGLAETAQGATEARQDLNQLGDAASTVENDLTGLSSRAATTGRNLSAAFENAGRSMADAGDAMTASVTLPIVALGGLTLNTAGDFEKAMNRVKAATEASGDQFIAMRQEAIDLGSTTSFSASEAAAAMYELASAGFDTQQIMDALPGVLDMAASGSVGLADAAEIASGIMNGYGFAAKDLTMVNDVLARDFLATATSLADLGESFQYVAPTAKSAGLSFTEVAAAIGLMGNAGIKGSTAGTGLNSAIASLVKPSKDAENTLRELGVTVVDSSGKLLPLVDIVRQLSASGADTADMMTIFGLEAGPKMQALVSQGADALANLDKQLQASGGTAKKVADTQMEGLNGAMDNLSSAAEGLMIAIGDAGLLKFMTDLAVSTTNLVSELSKLSPETLRIATVFLAFLASIGPVLMVVGRLSLAIGVVGAKLKLFWAWLIRVAPSLTALTGPVGWVIAAIIALGVALFVAYKKFEGFRNVVDTAFQAIATAATWLYQNIFLPIFTALGGVIMNAWSGVIRPALGYIATQFGVVAVAVVGFWNNSVRPALAAMIGFLGRLATAVRSWWVGNGDTVMASVVAVVTWLGGVMTNVWSGIMNTLKTVAAVIAWLVTNVSIPFLTTMISTVLSVARTIVGMKNVWRLVGTVLATEGKVVIAVLVAAFKILKTAVEASISNFKTLAQFVGGYLGPVVSAAAAVIKTVIGAAAQYLTGTLLPALSVAAGWLNQFAGRVMAFLSPVGAALARVGAIIVNAFVTYVLPALSKFGSALQVVVNVATWLWNTLSPLFLALANLVWTIWTGVLSIVFNLIKLAVTVLVSIFQVLWSVVQVAFTIIAAVVMAFWSIVQPILSAVGTALMWLWNTVISPVLTVAGALFMWLAGVVTSIFKTIVSAISWAVSSINVLANGLSHFVSSVANFFQLAVNAINEKINAAVTFVRGLPGAITGAVGNLGSILYEAGKSVIQGLINGIRDMIGSLRDAMSSVASVITDHLPFSPAKVGPLSGSGDPTISGGKITSMIATGLEERIPDIQAAIGAVAQTTSSGITELPAIASTLGGAPIAMPTRPAVGGGGNTYYLTVNAIDPRSAADSVMAAIGSWERSNGKGWRA